MTIEHGKVNSSVCLSVWETWAMCEFKIKTKRKMDNEHCVVWSSLSPFNTITIETQWNHNENIINVNISSARRKLWIRSVLVRINCFYEIIMENGEKEMESLRREKDEQRRWWWWQRRRRRRSGQEKLLEYM